MNSPRPDPPRYAIRDDPHHIGHGRPGHQGPFNGAVQIAPAGRPGPLFETVALRTQKNPRKFAREIEYQLDLWEKRNGPAHRPAGVIRSYAGPEAGPPVAKTRRGRIDKKTRDEV